MKFRNDWRTAGILAAAFLVVAVPLVVLAPALAHSIAMWLTGIVVFISILFILLPDWMMTPVIGFFVGLLDRPAISQKRTHKERAD